MADLLAFCVTGIIVAGLGAFGFTRHRATQRARHRRREVPELTRSETARAYDASMSLLKSKLNPVQLQGLKQNGMFYVKGSLGNLYQINATSVSMNVHRLKPVLPWAKGTYVSVRTYCYYPRGVPLGDVILAQVLLLRCNELAFRVKAEASSHPPVVVMELSSAVVQAAGMSA